MSIVLYKIMSLRVERKISQGDEEENENGALRWKAELKEYAQTLRRYRHYRPSDFADYYSMSR